MKITPKLIILFLVIALLPVIIVSALAYIATSGEITKRVISDVGILADRQKQAIESILAGHDATTTTFSTSYDLRSNLDSYLKAQKPEQLKSITDTLLALKIRFIDVVEISVLDPSDTLVASTNQSKIGETIETNDLLRGAGKKITIAQEKDGSVRLYFWNRLIVDGRELGTLRTSFNAFAINGVLQDYAGLGDSGQTALIQFDASNKAVAVAPQRLDKDAAFNLIFAPSPLTQKTDASYDGVPDYRGEQVVAATRYLPDVDWQIIVTQSAAEVFLPVTTLRNTLIIISVLSCVFIIAAALYFARLFTAPIITLTQKTRLIMQGNLDQTIPVKSADEIGTLASSFNNMTARLQELYRGLEQKVAERTQALNYKVSEQATAKAKDDAIITNIGEGLLVTDVGGRLLLMNPAALELFLVAPDSYIGKDLAEVVTLTDEDGSPFIFKNSLGLVQHVRAISNVTVTRKDGSKGAVSITITPIIVGQQIIGAIGIARDTTKEKEVDRMKTEFISLASHQLRTPLSAIKWFTEMLAAGDAGALNKEQAEFTRNIAGSTERMIALVTSLLNISRIESGRIIIDPRPTDLKELLNGIVNDLKAKIEERKQTLVITVHPDLPKINLDRHLIGQVYLNLLTNAIKYTPKGGEISVVVSRKDNDLISQVSDNGYGVPKSEQGRMFQKFFRATNIIKVEADGTGLGLYLIKSIVESSGGKIWFKSEEGKGTTFWFTLPLSGMKAKAGEVTIGE